MFADTFGVTFKFDTRQFNADIKKAIATSSRSAQTVINSKALNVATKALKLTEKADKSKIAQALSVEGKQGPVTWKRTITRGKNKGTVRTGQAFTRDTRDDSLAARLVNARRKWAGEKLLFGEELQRAADKLIASKLRSSAFIKSGWIWAIQDLVRAIRGRDTSGNRDGAKAKGAKKGGATVRNSRMQSFAVQIWNTALVRVGKFTKPGKSANPMPVAEKALAQAMQIEQQSMREHLARKMKTDLKNIGAKVT